METDERVMWLVSTNTDLTEGRGYDFPIHICEIEATARRLASKAYVQGTMAPISKVTIKKIEGRWYGPIHIVAATTEDMRSQKSIDAQRDALSRAKAAGLSDADIAALSGIKP